MTRKTNRLLWIGTIGCVLALAVGMTMFALRSGISFAMSPTELLASSAEPGQRIRLFGLVEEGSVVKGEGLEVAFVLSDAENTVNVSFNNILPDLFRENQGIITEGSLNKNGQFVADTVLAKHDENYMPADMAEKLKKNGVWKGDEAKN